MTVQEILATARDWGILVLFVQWFLLALLPAFVLWKVTRALKGLLPKAKKGLAALRARGERVTRGIMRVMAAVRRPFIWLSGLGQGLQTIVRRYQAKDL